MKNIFWENEILCGGDKGIWRNHAGT